MTAEKYPLELDTLLAIADRGWALHPLAPGTKQPATKKGFKDATTDPEQLTAWWEARPELGWGTPTGHVADIDRPDDLGIELPEVAVQSTPSGGRHVLMKANGVDLRLPGKLPGKAGEWRPDGKAYIKIYEPAVFLRYGPEDLPDVPDTAVAAASRPVASGDEPMELTTREELISFVGKCRDTGLEPDDIFDLLVRMKDDGRIYDSDESDPWTVADLKQLAREAGKWKRGEVVPAPRVKQRQKDEVAREAGASALMLTPASEIQIRAAKWLWADRVPLGELSLLAGREGVGKSTFDAWMAAQVSTGSLPGVHEGHPRNVLIVATEDDWSTTIVPRLMAAGADLTRIYRVSVQVSGGKRTREHQLHLPNDFDAFEEGIQRLRPGLITFSPLVSRLSSKLDSHKDQEVRQALDPLVDLAHEYSTTILGLIHLNKTSTTDPLKAVMASAAFPAVARAVLFIQRDPSDREVRLLGQPKNSLGKDDVELGLLAFHIEGSVVGEAQDGEPVSASRMVWDGPREGSTEQVMAESATSSETRTLVQEAVEWLKTYLTDAGGYAPHDEIKKAGKESDFGRTVLDRARVKAGVISQRTSTIPSRTVWFLPGVIEPPKLRSSHTDPVAEKREEREK